MELVVTSREIGKKSLLKKIRQQGNIPATIYAKGQTVAHVVVDGVVFGKFLSYMETGMLASTVFTLQKDGQAYRAIVKDIQYDVTTYAVIHIDFEEIKEGQLVRFNMPIRLVNTVDCVGVKLGGTLRQIIRSVAVECKSEDIIPCVELDVGSLGLSQSKKLSDIQFPETIRPLSSLKEVAATVSRR